MAPARVDYILAANNFNYDRPCWPNILIAALKGIIFNRKSTCCVQNKTVGQCCRWHKSVTAVNEISQELPVTKRLSKFK